jgi:hypothetical protein
MIKASDYLKDFILEPNFEEIEELIKKVQYDAITETISKCVKQGKGYLQINGIPSVSQGALLDVENKLKKEIYES